MLRALEVGYRHFDTATVNRCMRDHDAAAPKAYPHVHFSPRLFAQPRAAADADGINLWAGQAYSLAEAIPAASSSHAGERRHMRHVTAEPRETQPLARWMSRSRDAMCVETSLSVCL